MERSLRDPTFHYIFSFWSSMKPRAIILLLVSTFQIMANTHPQRSESKNLKPLPIGISSFENIIEGGYIYVDKTAQISKLIQPYGFMGDFHFMRRPTGFGKSLLLSTIEQIFRNNKELFYGTEIYHSDYKWDEYPIVKIDFSQLTVSSPEELTDSLIDALTNIAKSYKISYSNNTNTSQSLIQFHVTNLIQALNQRFSKRVVILIDEYDHAYLQNFYPPHKAGKFLEIIETFYLSVHNNSACIKYMMTVGVSVISKCLRSKDLINVESDISLYWVYADIAGFTGDEVRKNFADHVEMIAAHKNVTIEEVYSEMKSWYNGYQFSDKKIHVFNPYSLLQYLQTGETRDFWTETNKPFSKLIRHHIRNDPVIALDHLRKNESHSLEKFHIKDYLHEWCESELDLEKFLFQTGYFCITDDRNMDVGVNFANREVKEAFRQHVRAYFVADPYEILDIIHGMKRDIETLDIDTFVDKINTFVTLIRDFPFPREWRKEDFDEERLEETHFLLKIYSALRLTQEKEDGFALHIFPGENWIWMSYTEEEPIYLFEFTKNEQDPVGQCMKICKKKPWDNWWRYINQSSDREVNVCVGITYDTYIFQIDDWGVVKFPNKTGERVKKIYSSKGRRG